MKILVHSETHKPLDFVHDLLPEVTIKTGVRKGQWIKIQEVQTPEEYPPHGRVIFNRDDAGGFQHLYPSVIGYHFVEDHGAYELKEYTVKDLKNNK